MILGYVQQFLLLPVHVHLCVFKIFVILVLAGVIYWVVELLVLFEVSTWLICKPQPGCLIKTIFVVFFASLF